MTSEMGTRTMEAPPLSAKAAPAAELERECLSYALYLTGRAPSRYVIEKYLDFHRKFGHGEIAAFDRLLLSVSARGPFWTRLADSYGSVWRKESIVRQKLVVVLGLLECTPPTFETLDRVPGGGLAVAVLRMGLGAAAFVASLLIATLLFTPARLWLGARGSR